MKQYILYLAAGLSLAACAPKETTIQVSNELNIDRNEELVQAQVETFNQHILVDANGKEVPYQIVQDGIVFQANVAASATNVYTWKVGTPTAMPEAKTTAFFLGDRRKDDFAWENDKAGYRMYGPALLPENPSSGVDLWLKHTPALTCNAMYKQEEAGKPYHIDYGLGIDSYKVGHAAGCGGVAIVANNEIWPGGPYKNYEILQEGPLQTIFKLTYDSVQVADQVLCEELIITVNAGAQVNKAQVTFTGADVPDMQVGGAIFLHDSIDNLVEGNEEGIGYLAYCENATSDKGIYKIHESQGIDANTLDFGRNYVAVLMDHAEAAPQLDITKACIKQYKVGDTFTYYFGGGWSKRDYKTDNEWIEATRQTALCIAHPLQVTVK